MIYEEVKVMEKVPHNALSTSKTIHKGLFTKVKLVTVKGVVGLDGSQTMVAKILNSKCQLRQKYFIITNNNFSQQLLAISYTSISRPT